MQKVKLGVYLKPKISVYDRRLVFTLAKLAEKENSFIGSLFYLKTIVSTLTMVKRPKIWHVLFINAILERAGLAGPPGPDDIQPEGDPIDLMDQTLAKIAVKIGGATQERLARDCSPEELRTLYEEAIRKEEIERIDFERAQISANVVAQYSTDDRLKYLDDLKNRRVELVENPIFKEQPKQIGSINNGNEIEDETEDHNMAAVFQFRQ